MKMPEAVDSTFTLAEDMDDGLVKHEVDAKIKQNTRVAFKADLDAARKAQADLKTAESNKKKLSTGLTVADSNAKSFLGIGRKVYATNFGERWTQEWEATGFPDRSTAVPSTQSKRESLLKSTQVYLEANPDMEVNTTKLVFTAARAEILFKALKKARGDVADGNLAAGKAKVERDAAIKVLRARMSGLNSELDQTLEDDDPLWLAFGLPLPGTKNLPDSPDGLVLTAGPAGTVLADWHHASRATYYRVFVMVVDVDAQFRHVDNVNDSDCTLANLPSGKTVRVQIISGNESGYSEAVIAEIVVP